MEKYASLARLRRKQRTDQYRLRFAQIIVSVVRVIFRGLEWISPPDRRARLRELRGKMDNVNLQGAHAATLFQAHKTDEGLEAVQTLLRSQGDHETADRLRATQERLSVIREEADLLRQIKADSGGSYARAAEGYRAYLEEHPESAVGYHYLGGTLAQGSDWDGSLNAYREAVRLEGQQTTSGAMSRLQVANVLRQKGDHAAAVAELRSILAEATPATEASVGLAYLQLGMALNEMGDRKEAHSAWKEAIVQDRTKVVTEKARDLLRENP